jgi:hypothetical protein
MLKGYKFCLNIRDRRINTSGLWYNIGNYVRDDKTEEEQGGSVSLSAMLISSARD